MGNITRIITNQSQWISKEDFDIISKINDISFSSINQVNIDGKENGHQIGSYKYNDEKNNEKDFPHGWWTYDFEGKKRVEYDKGDKTGFRSFLEKTVFFQIEVNDRIPIETPIEFKLYDYDTALGFDNLNPDDYEFDGKEIKKTAYVREADGKKRITIELYLESIWKKEIAEDRGSFRDGCLDLYWRWLYERTDWKCSEDIILRVYPSDLKLRLKPALSIENQVLPEIYSHEGDILAFAIERLSNGQVQKFVSVKIRTTTTFTSIEGINKFKKEIYTESIDLSTNNSKTPTYKVQEVEHFFKVEKDFKKIFVEDEIKKLPVQKGSDIAIYNSIKKTIKLGKEAAGIYGHIMVLDEMRNMIPELSNNGKFNMPSLSTFIGFIPGAQIIAFGVGVLEWIAKDQIKETYEWVNEKMWITWQNEKAKGLDSAKNFIRNYWSMDNGFECVIVDQITLNALLKGSFKTKDELITESFKNMSSDTPKYSVFIYRIIEEEIEEYYDIIDCIYLNK